MRRGRAGRGAMRLSAARRCRRRGGCEEREWEKKRPRSPDIGRDSRHRKKLLIKSEGVKPPVIRDNPSRCLEFEPNLSTKEPAED